LPRAFGETLHAVVSGTLVMVTELRANRK